MASEGQSNDLNDQNEHSKLVENEALENESDAIEKTVLRTGLSIDPKVQIEMARLSKTSDHMVGRTLNGRFEILSVIGKGGMGYVYKARSLLMNSTVAVKMLNTELLQNQNSIRRLQQEAQATGTLDHPNTVGIRHFDLSEAGEPYMVMEYLEGRSLAALLEIEEKLQPERAVKIFKQIAAALGHAHDKGIVHRDLKTSNIFLVNNGGTPDFVKVIDFGIAKVLRPEDGDVHANLTMTGEIIGSPLSMSPEQCRGGELDARSDIYSFGCLMYQVLTGKPVFIAKNTVEVLFKQLNTIPDSFKLANPKVKIQPRLEAIVFKALQKNHNSVIKG